MSFTLLQRPSSFGGYDSTEEGCSPCRHAALEVVLPDFNGALLRERLKKLTFSRGFDHRWRDYTTVRRRGRGLARRATVG